MCTISNKLQLCTCNESSDEFRNYWVYYRLDENKEKIQLVGEVFFPKQLERNLTINNKRILCRMLNKASCFDFELIPHHQDILELIFSAEEGGSVTYSYQFVNNKWHSFVTKPFLTGIQHDKLLSGFIQNGMTRPIKPSDFVKVT